MKGTSLFKFCVIRAIFLTIGTILCAHLLGSPPSVFQGTLLYILWIIALATINHV